MKDQLEAIAKQSFIASLFVMQVLENDNIRSRALNPGISFKLSENDEAILKGTLLVVKETDIMEYVTNVVDYICEKYQERCTVTEYRNLKVVFIDFVNSL